MRVGVSQRVEIHTERGERRDTLDRRLVAFLAAAGCTAVPVPNLGADVEGWLDELGLDGVVLSGGNDLVAYGGDAPERDETERRLVERAERDGLPVLGICRGMQLLAQLHGSALLWAPAHAGSRHRVLGDIDLVVDSHHGWAVERTPPEFETLALAGDGTVEAMLHRRRPVLGVMWHPERVQPFRPVDLATVTTVLRGLAVR